MQKTAFIIHGAFGNPEENWIPWLKKQLIDLNYQVIVLKFPTPEGQNLENWLKVFEKYLKLVNKETIFVGHSIAPAFIIDLIQAYKLKIKAAYLISGFYKTIGNNTFDPINKPFFLENIDWQLVKNSIGKIFCFYGDNDPYINQDVFENFIDNLSAQKTIIENGGHLNASAGFLEFDQLLSQIKLLN